MSCLSMCVCLSWHHSANQPKSSKAAGSHNTPPKGFCFVSLYGGPTNAAQLCNERQTNTCVLLVKTPSSRVLSHACFSRTSFHLCLLQPNIPALAFHLCPLQGNAPSRVLPQQNTTRHTWLSKERLSFYFTWYLVIWVPCICWLLALYQMSSW